MSAAKKIKEELLAYIHSLDDKSLRVVHAIVGAYVSESERDFWDDLTDEQKAKIQLSREQHRAGMGIPHEQVMKEFREKYSK